MKTARTLLALLALGCSVDPSGNSAFTDCSSDAECAPGQTCDRGFCVMSAASDAGGPDAEVPLDGGPVDAGLVDAMAEDAGPTCVPNEIVCNGIDDDCDGDTDEFDTTTCDTESVGICAQGTYVCSGGGPACAATTFPQPEQCNGRDDDCDGATDELEPVQCYPSDTDGCSDTDGDGTLECVGACRAGTAACSGGVLGACEGFVGPAEETFGDTPAGDEDCDGTIDEGASCTMDQECYGGPPETRGVGACVAGTQHCDTGTGMLDPTCADQVLPSMETCEDAMVDDDCNGVTDDIPGFGDPCVASTAIGQCQLGTRGCDGSGPGLVCLPGMPGMERCDGNDNDCNGMVDEGFDLATDEANCGACGNVCGTDETCCGGTCVDTRMALDHCGACAADGGDSCDASSEVCCNGTCTDSASCGTCTEDCGAMGRDCCRGACVDYQTDESHCGGCGMACGAGQVCCGGTCVGSDASHCGQSCSTCAAGSELCCSGSCVTVDTMNCNACGASCGPGSSCCGSGCANLQTDATNCGTCGMVCGGSDVCSAGHCCPSGQTWCEAQGTCRNLANDANNCGTCGNVCGAVSPCCRGGMCRGLLGLGC